MGKLKNTMIQLNDDDRATLKQIGGEAFGGFRLGARVLLAIGRAMLETDEGQAVIDETRKAVQNGDEYQTQDPAD